MPLERETEPREKKKRFEYEKREEDDARRHYHVPRLRLHERLVRLPRFRETRKGPFEKRFIETLEKLDMKTRVPDKVEQLAFRAEEMRKQGEKNQQIIEYLLRQVYDTNARKMATLIRKMEEESQIQPPELEEPEELETQLQGYYDKMDYRLILEHLAKTLYPEEEF